MLLVSISAFCSAASALSLAVWCCRQAGRAAAPEPAVGCHALPPGLWRGPRGERGPHICAAQAPRSRAEGRPGCGRLRHPAAKRGRGPLRADPPCALSGLVCNFLI